MSDDHYELPDGTRVEGLAIVEALAAGIDVRLIRAERTEIEKVTEAVSNLLHLTECRCEDAWTARGRHAPECVEEYRDDVEILTRHLNWPGD